MGTTTRLARFGPGQFLGELSLLTGLRVFVTTRVTTPGEVLQVPKTAFKKLIATQSGLSDKILAAYIARRSILLANATATIRVIGSRFSKESVRIREFLSRLSIPNEWLDPDRHEEVDGVLEQFAVDAADLPVVIISGTVLRRPSTGELAEYLGLTLQSLPERCFDLIVVGAGPADSPPPSTVPPKASPLWAWNASGSAGRRARAPGSRTTLASRPASRAASWPSGRSCRRRSSAPA